MSSNLIQSNVHPSPPLYMAPQYRSKVRANCTTWCIHVAQWAYLGQNGFKMGAIVRFEHHKSSCLQKHIFEQFLTHFGHKMGHLKGFRNLKHGSKRAQNGFISLFFAPPMVDDHFWIKAFLTHCGPKRAHFPRMLPLCTGQSGSKEAFQMLHDHFCMQGFQRARPAAPKYCPMTKKRATYICAF